MTSFQSSMAQGMYRDLRKMGQPSKAAADIVQMITGEKPLTQGSSRFNVLFATHDTGGKRLPYYHGRKRF